MEIKPATLEDVSEIITLGNSVNEFQVSDQVVTFWPEKVLADCIKNKQNPIFIAVENKQIVGFVIANYNPSFKKAIVENIFVDPSFRGRGIGKSLLNNLLNRLKELGCEYICSLIEIKDESGVQFYFKNGFNRGIDCVWMDKILDEYFNRFSL